MEIKVGMYVRSLAGHDKDKVYVAVDVKDDFVYVADGKNKLLSNPKKKKIKHVQKINLFAGSYDTDEKISRALDMYENR